MEKSKRYIWLDIIKMIACFCVIVNHTEGYLLEYTNYAKMPTLFYCMQFCLCKMGIPLFIMTTGYLLLTNSQNNEFNFKDVFRRIFRIIIPLIGIQLLLFIKDNGLTNFSLIAFLKSFLHEPYMIPYWYLYMLIGLYLITPFIKKMVNNFNINDYKIFIVIFLVIPSLLPILNNYMHIDFSNYFFQAFFPMIMAFFIAGVYLSKVTISKKKLWFSIFLLFISSIFYFLTLYYPYLTNGNISYQYDTYTSIFCIVQSFALFYIIRHLLENFHFNKRTSKIIEEISKTTFGIYLIHALINHRIYNFQPIQNIFSLNACLGIIILEIVIFIIGSITTFFLRKIPVVKKFL